MIVSWAWRYLWFLKMWLKQKLGTEYRMFWNSDFKLLSLFCFWIFALLFFVNLQEYESITPSQESIEEGNPVLNIDCWKESQVLTFNQESGDGIALDKVSIYDITPYINFYDVFIEFAPLHVGIIFHLKWAMNLPLFTCLYTN